MDIETSQDGTFSGTSSSINAGLGRPTLCIEDHNACFFDDADDECLTPGAVGQQPFKHATFGNHSLRYFGRKAEECVQDMEVSHSERVQQMDRFSLPQIEHMHDEESESFDGILFHQYFQQQGYQNPEAMDAKVFQATTCTAEGREQARILLEGPTPSIAIPNANLPPQYKNSKILTAFYSKVDGSCGGGDRSGSSSVASSPKRSVSLSPCTSPDTKRRSDKPRVKNRDVNVWAPGSL